MPIWVPLSLLYPTLNAMVNVVDKVMVDRYSPTVYTYAFWLGIFSLAQALIILGVIGTQGLDVTDVLGGILAGAVSATGVLIFLPALKRGQIARIAPIRFLSPLMVAPMAAGFLGETISAMAAVAIVLAVLGGVLVSWQGGRGVGALGDLGALFLVATSAVFQATSLVLAKYFLDQGGVWHFYAAYRLGFAPALIVFAVISPEVRRSAPAMLRSGGFMGSSLRLRSSARCPIW